MSHYDQLYPEATGALALERARLAPRSPRRARFRNSSTGSMASRSVLASDPSQRPLAPSTLM